MIYQGVLSVRFSLRYRNGFRRNLAWLPEPASNSIRSWTSSEYHGATNRFFLRSHGTYIVEWREVWISSSSESFAAHYKTLIVCKLLIMNLVQITSCGNGVCLVTIWRVPFHSPIFSSADLHALLFDSSSEPAKSSGPPCLIESADSVVLHACSRRILFFLLEQSQASMVWLYHIGEASPV